MAVFTATVIFSLENTSGKDILEKNRNRNDKIKKTSASKVDSDAHLILCNCFTVVTVFNLNEIFDEDCLSQQIIQAREEEQKLSLAKMCKLFHSWPLLSLKKIAGLIKWRKFTPGQGTTSSLFTCLRHTACGIAPHLQWLWSLLITVKPDVLFRATLQTSTAMLVF